MVTIEQLYGLHQSTGKEAKYYKEKIKNLGGSAIRKKEGEISRPVGIVCLSLHTASKGETGNELEGKFNVAVCDVFYEKCELKQAKVRDERGCINLSRKCI